MPDLREYHLQELKIALNRSDPARSIPPLGQYRRVLDVGCGAGQTLIALDSPGLLVGIDIDIRPLRLGLEWTQKVLFAAAVAEQLPFGDQTFDFVISRVAVPYMRLPDAFNEMARVLVPGGRIWLTLHPLRRVFPKLRRGSVKERIFALYSLLNGLLLHSLGRTFALPNGTCESMQSERGIRIALQSAGFCAIKFENGRHMLVTASKTRS